MKAGNVMSRSNTGLRFAALALAAGITATSVHAQEQSIETAALRCSAMSLVHSPLTVPSPQFGELMTQFAGLFAQIHILHKGQRTKAKVNPNDVLMQRDAIITELNKGWPGVKNDRIREAATCNAWRNTLFAKVPEKPSEKEFQAALLNIGMPPANVSKEELDNWAKLTPQAFAMWGQLKVHPKDKK